MIAFLKKVLIPVILTIFVLTYSGYAVTFSDIDEEHKNYDAVVFLNKNGIVNGYDDGSFKPDNSVTRAELCVIFSRAAGYVKNTGKFEVDLPFSDVYPEYWAEDYIKYAYNSGIVNGMGDGTFLPAGGVTFEQAIKMLVCFVNLEDEAKRSVGEKWYTGYVHTAYDYNLLADVNVEITKKAKRSDIVQLIYNAYTNDLIKAPEEEITDEFDEEADDVFNDDENIIVHKEIKRILVDAGHNYSGYDIGARDEAETVKEEIITWQISDKLAQILEDYGFEVYVTRKKKTSNVANTSVIDSLNARVEMAHEKDVDLFISIHCNSGGGTGVETYCFEKESVGGVISEMICNSISKSTGLYTEVQKPPDIM